MPSLLESRNCLLHYLEVLSTAKLNEAQKEHFFARKRLKEMYRKRTMKEFTIASNEI